MTGCSTSQTTRKPDATTKDSKNQLEQALLDELAKLEGDRDGFFATYGLLDDQEEVNEKDKKGFCQICCGCFYTDLTCFCECYPPKWEYESVTKENTRPKQVLRYIDGFMSPLLEGRHIKDLVDKELALLICHAFYRSEELYDHWKECDRPIFSAFLVIDISESFRRYFLKIHDTEMALLFEEQKDKYCDFAKRLQNRCYKSNITITKRLLNERYVAEESFIKKNDTLLDLAYECKAESFFSHISCHEAINDRWKPGFRSGKRVFVLNYLLMMCTFGTSLIFHPCCITFKYDDQPLKNRPTRRVREFCCGTVTGLSAIQKGFRRSFLFLISPCFKFALHTTFYAVYLIYFARFLQGVHSIKIVHNFFSNQEYTLLIFWQFMFFLEVVLHFWRHFFRQKTTTKGFWSFLWQRQLFTTVHSIITCINFAFFTAALALDSDLTEHSSQNTTDLIDQSLEKNSTLSESNLLKSILNMGNKSWRNLFFSLSELCFFVSFVYSGIWMLRVLTIHHFFSSIVMTIKKMMQLFFWFLFIFLAFWITYSICQVALMGKKSNSSIVWQLFSNGAFEIFGELLDEARKGELNCTLPDYWDEFDPMKIQCAFRSWMVPVVLFVYTITTGVLIINILTALINQHYEKAVSSEQWRILWYERMVEYEGKPYIPPPFTLLNFITYLIWGFLLNCCCRRVADAKPKGDYFVYCRNVQDYDQKDELQKFEKEHQKALIEELDKQYIDPYEMKEAWVKLIDENRDLSTKVKELNARLSAVPQPGPSSAKTP